MTPDSELPVWARENAFPEAAPGWGWVDRKGREVPVGSFEELSRAIVEDGGARVDLVWTPAARGWVLPEEIPELHPALREARIRWARWEMGEGKQQMTIFGAILVVMVAWNFFSTGKLTANASLGLGVLLFFLLGALPWYQGYKRLKRAKRWAAGEMAVDAPVLRFETWLSIQNTPVTRLMFRLMVVAAIVQLFSEIVYYNGKHGLEGMKGLLGLWHYVLGFGTLDTFGISIAKAGLTKVDGAAGDWWRLLTAPFLHGHWLHWLMNASALAYLGKRVECFARWPHMAMVLLLSAWVGGEASARFMDKTSVGISGGLMGLLGFLLVFESMHRSLVPESARKRLVAGIVMTGIIGYVFRHFIDNAAHAGGLIAGMIYAAVVFPKSSSPHRPRTTSADLVLGGAAVGLLIGSAVLACVKMVG
ncbi:rhomboid family intramembrane serine protease [Luteolibacter flavescens]|uniref:Rhomboid family intramembrane serine protease n=1 Tax=Luteolibacter flavescens TaxID=1859460 RepID=A0ABT3FTZ4_9BACT|nr:rhomboid family intramembrane serine protease [Luteolibacter flavescens]MCW1887040.1 rhomboid family intramembrane serine protease [Luteolibacter flavescens]